MKALEGQLDEQREQLELSREQATELLARQEALQQNNEEYRQQNSALIAENSQLADRMEQMERAEQERKELYRKIAVAGGILLGLLAAYALSVRIWRYLVWRKQGREGQGAAMP